MEDKKMKYLEFVQGIINRMAECSFKCKEICILVCSAILAIFASIESHPGFLLLICDLPIIVFWLLDSYYLWQERGFRNTYSQKAVLNGEQDFDDFRIAPRFDENRFKDHFGGVVFSKTILPLYLSLFLATTISGTILQIIQIQCNCE